MENHCVGCRVMCIERCKEIRRSRQRERRKEAETLVSFAIRHTLCHGDEGLMLTWLRECLTLHRFVSVLVRFVAQRRQGKSEEGKRRSQVGLKPTSRAAREGSTHHLALCY